MDQSHMAPILLADGIVVDGSDNLTSVKRKGGPTHS
jgi:hypothetical protein